MRMIASCKKIQTSMSIAVVALIIVKRMFDDCIETEENEERLKSELEYEKARSMMVQMHPHFLYNALTSIQTIVKINPDYAYDLLHDFSVHLRGVIKSSTVKTISLEEELENVKAYLNIEKMRFGEKMRCFFDISCSGFEVIPLSIQPLVENSIKHGLFPRGEEGGTITVRSYEDDNSYIVQVIDDGVGFDPSGYLEEGYSGDSVGITNLVYRLREMVGAKLEYSSIKGEGTVATIRFKK